MGTRTRRGRRSKRKNRKKRLWMIRKRRRRRKRKRRGRKSKKKRKRKRRERRRKRRERRRKSKRKRSEVAGGCYFDRIPCIVLLVKSIRVYQNHITILLGLAWPSVAWHGRGRGGGGWAWVWCRPWNCGTRHATPRHPHATHYRSPPRLEA